MEELEIIKKHKIKDHVIVIDDSPLHNMIGILTRNDILKYIKIADVLYSKKERYRN